VGAPVFHQAQPILEQPDEFAARDRAPQKGELRFALEGIDQQAQRLEAGAVSQVNGSRGGRAMPSGPGCANGVSAIGSD
jgi:hypothetical protein